MLTASIHATGQPPLPPPGPSFPRNAPPVRPDDPFPFDMPAPPPQPLRNQGHVRWRKLLVHRGHLKDNPGLYARPDPKEEKPRTPAEEHEDEGRDEALDETFPASDPPAQGRTTGPGSKPHRTP